MKPNEPSGSRWKCATCGAFRPALDPLCDCGSYRWQRLGVSVEAAEALAVRLCTKPKNAPKEAKQIDTVGTGRPEKDQAG